MVCRAYIFRSVLYPPDRLSTLRSLRLFDTIKEYNIMPRNSRYVIPPEGAHHSHTLMAFPSIASAEAEDDLGYLQSEVLEIANTIARFEPVHLYARSELVELANAKAASNVVVKEATLD